MILLGIDTATTQSSCALGGAEGVLACFETRGRRHEEVVIPGVQFICHQAGIDLPQVSAIAVDIGPGLFNGLRVGIASAKALAYALHVPMIGLSSLDLLAFPLRHTSKLVVAALDARRGELFTATYRQVPGGIQRLTEPRLCSVDEVAGGIDAQRDDCVLVGDGGIRYAEQFRHVGQVEVLRSGGYPTAASLVELAQPIAVREQFVQPWELKPMYLRRSDAEENLERRAAGRGV